MKLYSTQEQRMTRSRTRETKSKTRKTKKSPLEDSKHFKIEEENKSEGLDHNLQLVTKVFEKSDEDSPTKIMDPFKSYMYDYHHFQYQILTF